MSELKEFLLPDIGADAADVTEILVAVGDTIAEDQDVSHLKVIKLRWMYLHQLLV